MAKRLNNLLRGQSAALRARSTPRLPTSVCLRRSLCRALHLDLLAMVLCFYSNWKKLWRLMRQLSGDDAYERYLVHHTAACHAATAPLSRKEFFQHEQQQKWSNIKRCC